MGDKITNIPHIRFKGFTEAWEQRKFMEVFVERRDKTVVENEDILLSCAINGMFLNSELFGHFRGSSTIGYLKVKKNDLILSAQNLHLGNANVNLRFEHGIISPAYKVFEFIDSDPNFIQAWVKKDATKNFFLAATTEGASQCRKNIEWKILYNQKMPLPSRKEQEVIGAFFKNLDNIITLHQRKLELLKVTKKSMLQKMFPKDGESVPEIRFAGFTDAWEQHKLGDVFNERSERSGVGELISVTINSGVVKFDDLDRHDNSSEDKSNYKRVEVGDIAYNSMRMWQGASGYSSYSGILSPAYTVLVPKEGVHSLFYAYLFKRHDMIQIFKKNSQGLTSDTWNLKFPALSKIKTYAPDFNEQRRIAKLFDKFDNLITLHQRELDLLKNFKKSMLQQMFI